LPVAKQPSNVKQQRAAGGQAADQPVPHHPAAGCEVEQGVGIGQADMQPVLLDMLDQRAAGAMNNALWRAGRP